MVAACLVVSARVFVAPLQRQKLEDLGNRFCYDSKRVSLKLLTTTETGDACASSGCRRSLQTKRFAWLCPYLHYGVLAFGFTNPVHVD